MRVGLTCHWDPAFQSLYGCYRCHDSRIDTGLQGGTVSLPDRFWAVYTITMDSKSRLHEGYSELSYQTNATHNRLVIGILPDI